MPMMPPHGYPQGYQQMPGAPINYQPGAMPPMGYASAAPGCGPVPPVGPGAPGFFPPAGGMPGGGMPGGGGAPNVEFGKTKNEIEADNQANAVYNQVNEPQDMKPGDDDPSRMYWTKELDGNWTTRNRFSLDAMKNFRWYVTAGGVFWAKMLPE